MLSRADRVANTWSERVIASLRTPSFSAEKIVRLFNRPKDLKSVARRLSRDSRSQIVLFVVVLDALIVAPLVSHSRLNLLDYGDYPVGPHSLFAPSAFGFPPGITSRAPVEALLYWLFASVRWPPVQLLPFIAVAPAGCLGFVRLFGRNHWAVVPATVVFTVNPFIYERMANGQVYIVMGYSLLPIVLALAIRPLASLAANSALGGLVCALACALSVHYLYILAVLMVIATVAQLLTRRAEVLKAIGGMTAVGALLSLYWLIPAMVADVASPSPVTKLDLSVFQSVPDRSLGLAFNVAALYGFWRPGPPLVKDFVAGWPFLFLAILLVVVFGVRHMWVQGGRSGRGLALTCIGLASIAILLAMGAQGPSGQIYGWLFSHLPGFKVMREPDKFASLAALGYSVGFGQGASYLTQSLTWRTLRIIGVCCLALLPIAYGFTELWGFAGYARPTSYPASWAAASRVVQPGSAALALPWRAYVQVPWIEGRVVANPVSGYFGSQVISADDLEAGPIDTETSNPRSLFLQFCLSHASHLRMFGRLLAALGIRYVLLSRVPGAPDYMWLSRQNDLKRVFESDSITVYRNQEPVPRAYQPRRRLVLRDWGQVVALAQRSPLTDYLIRVRHARPGAVSVPASMPHESSREPRFLPVIKETPVSGTIAVGPKTKIIVVNKPSYAGWHVTGFRATSQFGVMVAFVRSRATGSSGSVTAVYIPWRLIEKSDVVGVGLLAADILIFLTVLIGRRLRDERTSAPVGAAPLRRDATHIDGRAAHPG